MFWCERIVRHGDQVVGLTYEQTLSAVRKMAAIHAEFWMDAALEQHNWLPHHGLWFASPKQNVIEDFLLIMVFGLVQQ